MTGPDHPETPETPDDDRMPLIAAAQGQDVEFLGIDGGREVRHRLAEMGLSPGAKFRVVSRASRGPVMIQFKDARFVLGHGMVRRIFVRPA